jgi:hypothetical protein
LAAIIAALAGAACAPSPPPLSNSYRSPTELATAVLGALERRDVAGLHALALDEREFRDHVWPDLPAARPERNMPMSFVWGDLSQKSEASLSRTLGSHGGQRFGLVSVRFLGGTTRYDSYLVHRRTVLAVRDSSGTESTLRVFGSVLEKAGQFKVFSYVVED